MARPQFTSKRLLWPLAVAAAFLLGAEWNRRYQQPVILRGPKLGDGTASLDTLKMSDGTTWFRVVFNGTPQGRLTLPGAHGETITITPPPQPE